MQRLRINGRIILLVLGALVGALLATAQPAGAAEECAYSFRNNEAPDLKIKTVVDGREVTRILLTSGRIESITVTSEDTVVIRRPSDRERLYRASGCEGAGTVIDIGELPEDIGISCSLEQLAPGAERFTLTTELSEAPQGSYVAYKAYNPVDDEDYVFLGSFRTNGRTSISDELEITAPGEWRLTSRVRLADGSKLPRVDCGFLTVGDAGFPEGVIGNRSVDELPTSCWAHDKMLVDGTIVADVTILSPGDPRVVYARTADRFLGSIATRGEDFDSRIEIIKVRGGERQGTYECVRGWTGDRFIPVPDEADGTLRVEVEVMAAAPAENGGTNVLWRLGTAGFFNGGGTAWTVVVTNTLTGNSEDVFASDGSVWATQIDCTGRHVAVADSFFGETYPVVVDLESGDSVRLPNFLENSTNYGFDCDGRFWYEARDGVRFVELD